MKTLQNNFTTVYKYPLVIADYQNVDLPKGAQILCIKEQHGKICLWALVNPDETETETIKIRCAGTGHTIKESVEYNETIVFHFFKIK